MLFQYEPLGMINYDLIVTQLRNMKRSRQIIVVTHNANIVVKFGTQLVSF